MRWPVAFIRRAIESSFRSLGRYRCFRDIYCSVPSLQASRQAGWLGRVSQSSMEPWISLLAALVHARSRTDLSHWWRRGCCHGFRANSVRTAALLSSMTTVPSHSWSYGLRRAWRRRRIAGWCANGLDRAGRIRIPHGNIGPAPVKPSHWHPPCPRLPQSVTQT